MVGEFFRHARVGGHPAFSAKHFWIPALRGNDNLGMKKLPDPLNYITRLSRKNKWY
jgi:hypothetical protein